MHQTSSSAKTSLVTGGSDGIGKAIARIREGLSFAAVAVAAVVGVRAEGVLLDGDLRSSLPPLAAGTVLLCLLMTSRWLEDQRRHIAAENVA